MPHAVHAATAETFAAMLGTLSGILAKAAVRADAAGLLDARLAPDMFPLAIQVQLVCFHADNGVKRLMGREAAAFSAVQEAGFAVLQSLISTTRDNLAKLTPENFAGAGERHIVLPLQPPNVLEADGTHFMNFWLLPNFYFHLVTAYDILRANGLDIGKKDFMAHTSGFRRELA